MQYETISLSRLRLRNHLPRFLKVLQDQSGIGEMGVGHGVIGPRQHFFAEQFRSLLVLPFL